MLTQKTLDYTIFLSAGSQAGKFLKNKPVHLREKVVRKVTSQNIHTAHMSCSTDHATFLSLFAYTSLVWVKLILSKEADISSPFD